MTEQSNETVWFFAIGSMMNPVSLAGRNIHPIRSYPGIILDFKLVFFGKYGFAEAYPEVGQSFHGVLHELSLEDTKRLDSIEVSYCHHKCSVNLYNGESKEDCFVYVLDEDVRSKLDESLPPTERYIEILIEGCHHYGVAASHVEFLKSLPYVPRKKPSEYCKISVPDDLPVWTMDDVSKGDGLHGNPFYIAINGKVREFIGKKEDFFLYSIYLNNMAGKHAEMTVSKFVYEPKYGMHENIEDFTREHCDFIEDKHLEHDGFNNKNFRTVALINQKYRDE